MGFGVFSTLTVAQLRQLAGHLSQCPCGLWGLFYSHVKSPSFATPDRVSMPVWALGSFLPEVELQVVAQEFKAQSQCPCGLWGLFYAALDGGDTEWAQ